MEERRRREGWKREGRQRGGREKEEGGVILAMCYILFLIEQIDAPKEYISMYTSSTITCTRGLT